MPSTLESIEAETDTSSVTVIFTLNGTPEVRTFREDRSIVVDVGLDGAKPKQSAAEGPKKVAAAPQTAPAIAPPETVPAKRRPHRFRHRNLRQSPPRACQGSRAMCRQRLRRQYTGSTSGHRACRAQCSCPAPAKTTENCAAVTALHRPCAVAPVAAAYRADRPRQSPPRLRRHGRSCRANRAGNRAGTSPEICRRAAAAGAQSGCCRRRRRQRRFGDNLRLEFPFAVPTPAAVFRRADMLWLVFDSAAKIDLAALKADAAARDPRRGVRARRGRRSDRAHQAGAAAAGEPRCRWPGLDRQYRRHRHRADPSARRRAQHRRQGPRQHRHSVRRWAQNSSDQRSRRRRPADGDHRAWAGARLPQSPGLRRIARAAVDPRRGGAADRRRHHGRACGRQDHDRPPERAVALVDGARTQQQVAPHLPRA